MKRLTLFLIIAFTAWIFLIITHFYWTIFEVGSPFARWESLHIIFLFFSILFGACYIVVQGYITIKQDGSIREAFSTTIVLFGILLINAISLVPEIYFVNKTTSNTEVSDELDDYLKNDEYIEAQVLIEEVVSLAEESINPPSPFWLFDFIYFKTDHAEIKRQKDLGMAYYHKGYLLYITAQQADSVIHYLSKSINHIQHFDDEFFTRISARLMISYTYSHLGNFRMAEHSFFNVKTLLEDNVQREGIEKISFAYEIQYGYHLIKKGYPNEGLTIVENSIGQLIESSSDDESLYSLYIHKSNIQLMRGKYLSAQESLDAAEKLYFFEFSIPDKLLLAYLQNRYVASILTKSYSDAANYNLREGELIEDIYGSSSSYKIKNDMNRARLALQAGAAMEAADQLEEVMVFINDNPDDELLRWTMQIMLYWSKAKKMSGDSILSNNALIAFNNSLYNLFRDSTYLLKAEFYPGSISMTSEYIQQLNQDYIEAQSDSLNHLIAGNLLLVDNRESLIKRELRSIIGKDDRLMSLKSEIDSLVLSIESRKVLGGPSLSRQQVTLNGLIDDFENEFLPRYGSQLIDTAKTLIDLNENQAAVAYFTSLDNTKFHDNRQLNALIYANDTFEVIPLGDVSILETELHSSSSANSLNEFYSESSIRKVRSHLWTPLEPYMEGIDEINIHLTGFLNYLDFNTIFPEEYRLNRFLLLKDIFKSATDTISIAQVVTIGNIDYDYSNYSSPGVLRSRYENLPNSKLELDHIKGAFNNYDTVGVIELTAKSATKKNIDKLLPVDKKSIFHFATHGFYIESADEAQMVQILGSDLNFNPMLRSGLILSEDDFEDGVLNALEISLKDLDNVELVVLSACESGLGDYNWSEGLFGLPRAFKIAGAQKQLVTLWKVSDYHTSEFMKYFYKKLGETNNVNLAFAYARLELKSKYPDPYYWASFNLLN